MSPLQTGIAKVGLAKQTVKGTPVTPPAYGCGLVAGKPFNVAPTQAADKQTSGNRLSKNALRELAQANADYTIHSQVALIGLYLLGALGSVSTTGAGPYEHVFSSGDELPWFTHYSELDAEYQCITDVKVESLGLAWEGPKPLDAAVSLLGLTPDTKDTAWTATSDLTESEAFFVPIGGTFEIDGCGASPASAVVLGGELKVANSNEALVASGSILPVDLQEHEQTYECSLRIAPDDLDVWRDALTSTTSGTAVDEEVQYGSLNLQFLENRGGTATLDIDAARVAFECDFPDVNPEGGYAELALAGIPLYDGTDAPLKFTLSNAIASY